MHSIDPDTTHISDICQSLIGCEIEISYKITLQNKESHSSKIDNCNIIGNCMEDIIHNFIHKYIHTFEKGPPQASPDFYNENKKWEYELKCFRNTPSFDISNFNSYILQITNDLERKMYRTQYLIFKYQMNNNIINITDFKLCHIWEILNYTGKYAISVQSKKNIWYNIRPCKFNDMNSKNKTPSLFIKQICEAIRDTPNRLETDKQNIIDNINNQFNNISILQDKQNKTDELLTQFLKLNIL